MNNTIINETIPSKTVKEYLIKTNHKFSMPELISLVNNSSLTLERKIELIRDLKDKKSIKNILKESHENNDKLEYYKDILTKIEREMIDVIDVAEMGDKDRAILFHTISNNDFNTTHCIKNMDALRHYIESSNTILKGSSVEIIDLNTANIEFYVFLDSDLRITGYSDNTKEDYPEQRAYINIPNEFKVGDKVKIAGDDDTVYVVCYDTNIPDKLSLNLEYIDSSITLIEEELLDKNRDYKEQIEEIISNRIHRIDDAVNEESFDLDIISKYHDHVSIICVEKLEG